MSNRKTFTASWDTRDIKTSRFSRLDTISTIAFFVFIFLDVYLYASGTFSSYFELPANILSFWLALAAILGKFIMIIDNKNETFAGWELWSEIGRYALIITGAVAMLDIAFETYFIGHLLGMENVFDQLGVNVIITLICIILVGVLWLGTAGKMEGNKEWVIKYGLPLGMIAIGISGIVLILSFNNPLSSIIRSEGIAYEALHEGQSFYGGADMFVYTIESLLYSPIVAIMIGVMFVGTTATILSVNLDGAPALKNFGTVTVVVPPLLIIWSIFIGAVEPPSMFVKILGGESLASFIYAITMVSVFIILVMINAVFVQIADFFLPDSAMEK